jgi:hypothetical protein
MRSPQPPYIPRKGEPVNILINEEREEMAIWPVNWTYEIKYIE